MDVAVEYIFKGLIIVLAGIALFSIKGMIKQRTEVQRAPCGFMTLSDIEGYCQKRSDQYTASITTSIEGLVKSVDDRLDKGDQRFNRHSERLRGLEKQLIETTAVLRLVTDGTLKAAIKDAVKGEA